LTVRRSSRLRSRSVGEIVLDVDDGLMPSRRTASRSPRVICQTVERRVHSAAACVAYWQRKVNTARREHDAMARPGSTSATAISLIPSGPGPAARSARGVRAGLCRLGRFRASRSAHEKATVATGWALSVLHSLTSRASCAACTTSCVGVVLQNATTRRRSPQIAASGNGAPSFSLANVSRLMVSGRSFSSPPRRLLRRRPGQRKPSGRGEAAHHALVVTNAVAARYPPAPDNHREPQHVARFASPTPWH